MHPGVRLHEATDTTCELAEDLHRELVCQMLVSCGPRVQIVTGVILRRKLARDTWVSKELVKVGNRVKGPRVANEVVDLLPVSLSATDPSLFFLLRNSDSAHLVASLTGLE